MTDLECFEKFAREWKSEKIRRNPVRSSALKSVGYDPVTRELEVEFGSGSIHRYAEVPPGLAGRFGKVKSVGRLFHKHVRGKFESERMNPVEPSDGAAKAAFAILLQERTFSR